MGFVERGFGRPLFERAVRSMAVVVGDAVDDEAFDPSAVPDDGAVKEFPARGADQRVGHRRSYRGAEDLVKGVDELAASIPHERLGTCELVAVA